MLNSKDETMNDNGGLYFIVGGLAVIAIIGVILFSNGTIGHRSGSSATGGSTTIEHTVTPSSSTTTVEKKK